MRNPHRLAFILVAALSVGLGCYARASEPALRERLLMDPGWRFHLGDDVGDGFGLAKAGSSYGPAAADYGDSAWRAVDLPHDWAIELPFDPKADASHGFRAVGEGFRANSIGWYRRSFELPKEDAGRRLWLEFDGVYRDCAVFVNGWLVERHDGGYNGFRCDITDIANCGGRNVVAVRVDASRFEGWFYEGAGIYRHVWLLKTAPLAVAPDGVFVSSRFRDNVPSGPAEIIMQARLLNSSRQAEEAQVTWEVVAPGGTTVATATALGAVGPMATRDLEQSAQVRAPFLWSPESPVLYKLVTTVAVRGRDVDRVETPFGVRTVGFDANRGFMLNGRPYTLKGTSNHQDHAGVGSAVPDALQYFRIARLRELGCNAYRTAHNPPTPELLDACDNLGMLVMDENRMLGSDELRMAYLEEQLRRDRNHPSVAIWSLGNEEFAVQTTEAGMRVAATMQAFVKSLDSTRPVTINADLGNQFAGVDSVIEVRGWSYHVGPAMDAYHKEHPLQPNVGSEQGSTVGTRGIYADDKARGYVSSYDDFAPEWAQTAETWMSFFATRPWLSGGFVWTGFDYRGEPTPYGWPCVSSHFGIMDTCGFPKDNYWYYQAWWGNRTVLHLMPHWNWPGREGQEIDVRALTNCEEVELLVNGRSLGRKAVTPYLQLKWSVPYEPGALSARGYNGGRLAAEAVVETTGAPAAVQLKPDRPAIEADGRDDAVFTVSVVDEQGRVVPVASNKVSFEVEGPGRILGVGNGDPSCHEPDKVFELPVQRAVPIANWRWHKVENPYPPALPEESAQFDDSTWSPVDVAGEAGILGFRDKAVYRAHFSVTAADLAAPGAEILFGKLAGGVAVYVNGTKVGGTADPRSPSAYDVKALLHAGENVVAVSAANYGQDPYGISRGVALVLVDDPPAPRWSRSVFNGLAQVIVQAGTAPGAIKLTARSEGLKEAAFVLESHEPAP
jgi:beta-galactosidase